jgi:hypothetical protein
MTRPDHAPFVALGGLGASLTIADVNQIVSLGIGLVTLGYMAHKWLRFSREKSSDRAARRNSRRE